MSSAVRLFAVVVFWCIIGLSWAILNEYIVNKIPLMYPQAISENGDSWSILLFMWNMSAVTLFIGSALSILGQRDVRSVILAGCVVFGGMFTLIFLWAGMWEVVNVIVPDSLALATKTTSQAKANIGVYNTSFQMVAVGLLLTALLISGGITIGSGRRIRRIQRVEISKFKPKYAYVREKKVYGYPNKNGGFREIEPSSRLKLNEEVEK